MYVLLTLILATLAMWVIVYNILIFLIQKYEKDKKIVLPSAIDKAPEFVIKVVEKIEETAALKASGEEIELEEEPEVLGEQLDLLKEELEQLAEEPKVAAEKQQVLIEEPKASAEEQKVVIEEPKALETKQKKELELIRLLESKNVRYEDKRYKKEGFYLIGGGDLSRVILEANRLGYKFQLDKNKNRWYLQGFKIASKKRKDEIPKRRDAIIILLDGTDIEYVDKRDDNNGALWIIGGE